jgi:hypothetical protein
MEVHHGGMENTESGRHMAECGAAPQLQQQIIRSTFSSRSSDGNGTGINH